MVDYKLKEDIIKFEIAYTNEVIKMNRLDQGLSNFATIKIP
jgi:hypothetical protein